MCRKMLIFDFGSFGGFFKKSDFLKKYVEMRGDVEKKYV
jgi:hypothetical protein